MEKRKWVFGNRRRVNGRKRLAGFEVGIEAEMVVVMMLMEMVLWIQRETE